jgi:hypothetical protein
VDSVVLGRDDQVIAVVRKKAGEFQSDTTGGTGNQRESETALTSLME